MHTQTQTHLSRLLLFSFFVCLLTYGFALTNFSLSVDSESFIFPNYSLDLGRWGNNLVRYHIFNGHVPYFTILLGLIFLSFTSVVLATLFRLSARKAYLFCALFLSFPQMAYHMIFNMQADSVPLGFLSCALSCLVYLKSTEQWFSVKAIGFFILSALLMMFALSCYQGLVFMPVIIYLIRVLQETDLETFIFKEQFKRGLHFLSFLLVSALFYYLSVKLFCPPVDQGYLSSYTSGDSNGLFANFIDVWLSHLKGKAYYGEMLFLLVPILALAILVKSAILKNRFGYKFIILLLLLVVPYFIAFFITNNYYPPRLFVTSGIVFAFVVVYAIKDKLAGNVVLLVCGLFVLTNIYFVTKLFYSSNRIFSFDKDTARKIDMTIQQTYPNFDPEVNYVYFHGSLPYNRYDKIRLPDSEIFGGSLFIWDGGSNDRIINFFKFSDIAYYKMIDNREVYFKIKDSIEPMPIWPKSGSVKMINDVMVVRLGKEKGAKLWVE